MLATEPPIPPADTFPSYSPQDQADATTWSNADPRPQLCNPDDRAYQVRVAGQHERKVYGSDGLSQRAVGYRRNQLSRDRGENEVREYDSAIANPADHAQYLEVDTDGEVIPSF